MASFNLASDIIENMGMDPTRFLMDPEDQQAAQQVEQKQQQAQQDAEQVKQVEMAKQQLEAETASANIGLIMAEIDNKKIDNKRQLLQAEDESNREWAVIDVKAQGTEGAVSPQKIPVDFQNLYQDTEKQAKEQQAQQEQQQQMVQKIAQLAQENPEEAMQMAQQAGIDPQQLQQLMGG